MKNNSTLEFLQTLEQQEIQLWIENGQLQCDAPKGKLTEKIIVQLKEHKEHLLLLLQELQNNKNKTEIQAVTRPDSLPLSFAQQRLWFLDQLDHNVAYNMSMALNLSGPLNVTALQLSLQEIVNRHESLRTTFKLKGDTPVQVIHPKTTIKLPVVDLSHYSLKQQVIKTKQLMDTEASRIFDLSHDLMLRATLLHLSHASSHKIQSQHILLLSLHHIASDGWSIGLMMKELEVLYSAFSQGQPSPLSELAIQYADFALWQRNYLRGDVLSRQLDYWKECLADAPPLLQLPTDYPYPAEQSFQGDVVSMDIASELSRGLRRLSQEQGATLYMTLLAVFQILMSRYTGQTDVIVGSPIANRNYQEIESLIGFFINTLAMRANLASNKGKNPSFVSFLAQVKQTAEAAYDHQDLPFERLVEELQLERHANHNTLVQVIFSLQNAPMGAFNFSGLTVTPAESELQTTRFDLEMHIFEVGDHLEGHCIYRTDLFDKQTIERMMGHFQNLLTGVIANPHASITDLPLLKEEERHQILVEWNNTATDYPKNKCIHQLFEEQVERTPDALAVRFESDSSNAKKSSDLHINGQGVQGFQHFQQSPPSLTYCELNKRANQLAHHLISLGVNSKTLIGICIPRSLEMIVGLLAILKTGGAYVPLDVTYPEERLFFMLEDTEALVLLTQQNLAHLFTKTKTTNVLIDTQADEIARYSTTNPNIESISSQPAYIIYTSGSTGTPKGVVIAHCAINRLLINTNYIDIKPTDRIAQTSNISFDAATFEIWGALARGATLVGIPREVSLIPQDLVTYLRLQKISILFLTTALFNQVVLAIPDAFATLRYLLFGGEVCDPSTVQTVLQEGAPEQLLHVYGPTESTTYSTWYSVNSVPDKAQTVPIGRALANTQLYILDSQLQAVPVGIAGELYIGGDGLALGYLNRPELTAERFIDNPFGKGRLYKTDDLVRWLSDGNIEFVGRLDNQVKIRGFRIELGEIETTIIRHPQVNEAVVVAHHESPTEKRLVAYLVLNDAEVQTSKIQHWLQQKLPPYMVPATFIQLDVLPLTPNGKVDHHALPAPTAVERSNSFVAPQTVTEKSIADIWSEILNVERISCHDDFFERGGHSLLATQVISRIRQHFQQEIPLQLFFKKTTIFLLAQYLDALNVAQTMTKQNQINNTPLSEMTEETW